MFSAWVFSGMTSYKDPYGARVSPAFPTGVVWRQRGWRHLRICIGMDFRKEMKRLRYARNGDTCIQGLSARAILSSPVNWGCPISVLKPMADNVVLFHKRGGWKIREMRKKGVARGTLRKRSRICTYNDIDQPQHEE